MTYNWSTCPKDIRESVFSLNQEMNNIVPHIVGIYLHGSLAMGGFDPNKSDIDLIVITKDVLSVEHQSELVQLFLNRSNSPSPIEISFLNLYQVNEWTHPCPFDFHYSEFWREKYKQELENNTQDFLNNVPKTDADLAAHLTILNHRGICLEGKPISEVIPQVSKADYISSIMLDYHVCLNQILVEPDYCVPNLIRVYWYLKEEKISSKQEALNWGIRAFPKRYAQTINHIDKQLNKEDLISFRDFITGLVNQLR